MRSAYAEGKNAMAYARKVHCKKNPGKKIVSLGTTIAYDLQAGSYSLNAKKNQKYQIKWCTQIASTITKHFSSPKSLLEVGVGEATTLSGVQSILNIQESSTYGFDISWSRIRAGMQWQKNKGSYAELFVGDLFNIPLADQTIDVVYSSHSLEPNGGHEQAAIAECLRVARHAVILVEPIYELASKDGKKRMKNHGYVRGLRQAAEKLGASIAEYRLLPITDNKLNPSGVLALVKDKNNYLIQHTKNNQKWRCPLTGRPMEKLDSYFFAKSLGIAYPILKQIPLLKKEYAVIASKITEY